MNAAQNKLIVWISLAIAGFSIAFTFDGMDGVVGLFALCATVAFVSNGVVYHREHSKLDRVSFISLGIFAFVGLAVVISAGVIKPDVSVFSNTAIAGMLITAICIFGLLVVDVARMMLSGFFPILEKQN